MATVLPDSGGQLPEPTRELTRTVVTWPRAENEISPHAALLPLDPAVLAEIGRPPTRRSSRVT
jgi:hypothetical protein